MILIERQNRTSGVPVFLERWGLDATAISHEFTWAPAGDAWERLEEGAPAVAVNAPFDHPEGDHPEDRG